MKNFLLLLFVFFSIGVFGQTTRDVVFLKNGSVIKGTITEMNPSVNIKIKTADGSLFVYKIEEILKIEKEEFVGKEMNNNETSSSVSQSEVESYFREYLSSKRPSLKFVGVAKKNGIKREFYGQKIYEIEYELIMEVSERIFINTSQFQSAFSNRFNDDFSYYKSNSTGYEAALAGSKKEITSGQRILAEGKLNFEETDNGWRVSGFSNENFKIVSSNYMSPLIAKQKEEERKKVELENAQKLEKLKIELDWKKMIQMLFFLTTVFMKRIMFLFLTLDIQNIKLENQKIILEEMMF